MSDDADDTRERAEDAELRRWEENRMPERAEEDLKAAREKARGLGLLCCERVEAEVRAECAQAREAAEREREHAEADLIDMGIECEKSLAEAWRERDEWKEMEIERTAELQQAVADIKAHEATAAEILADSARKTQQLGAAEARLREVEHERKSLERKPQ